MSHIIDFQPNFVSAAEAGVAEEPVGQPVVRGDHLPGDRVLARQAADAGAGVRLGGEERGMVRRQGREQLVRRVEGMTSQ